LLVWGQIGGRSRLGRPSGARPDDALSKDRHVASLTMLERSGKRVKAGNSNDPLPALSLGGRTPSPLPLERRGRVAEARVTPAGGTSITCWAVGERGATRPPRIR
jgi:hypothetical protein